jgi:UDP-glucuronate decarboxylase
MRAAEGAVGEMTQLKEPDRIVAEDAEAVAMRCERVIGALRGKTLLVTGAAGMLPSALVHGVVWLNAHHFPDSPCRVLAVTRRPVDPRGPMAYLRENPTVTFLTHDTREPIPWEGRIDLCVHAASAASPKHYLREAVETLQVNSVGLSHLLERAHREGWERFLFISSGEIYGSVPDHAVPTPETYVGAVDPLGPRSCYVEAKRFGEALAHHFARQRRLPATIARPFQVHGPGLRRGDGRAFAAFAEAAIAGEPIIVESTGQARRTYCSLRDATAALWHILLEGRPGEAYNVGTSRPEITVLDLAHLIADLAGSGSRVEVRAQSRPTSGQGSPDRTCPDVTKIEQEFGWRPEDSLEGGFRRTLSWLRARAR